MVIFPTEGSKSSTAYTTSSIIIPTVGASLGVGIPVDNMNTGAAVHSLTYTAVKLGAFPIPANSVIKIGDLLQIDLDFTTGSYISIDGTAAGLARVGSVSSSIILDVHFAGSVDDFHIFGEIPSRDGCVSINPAMINLYAMDVISKSSITGLAELDINDFSSIDLTFSFTMQAMLLNLGASSYTWGDPAAFSDVNITKAVLTIQRQYI